MKIQEVINILDEGPHDPHIYKAIFMAGSPGSGKSYIAKKIMQGTGLKYLNTDKFYEWYLTNKKDIDFDKFQNLHDKEFSLYLNGHLGLIIDGTGRNLEKIKTLKIYLESINYDTMMIFVNTSLEVAISRAQNRQRPVDLDFLKSVHNISQQNIGRLQALFNDNFVVIDNTTTPDLTFLEKKIRRFLNSYKR